MQVAQKIGFFIDIIDMFKRLLPIAEARASLVPLGADPFNVVFDGFTSPTEASVNGKTVLLAGTNNYLGLTFDPDAIEAACEAMRLSGTGTTGSRMANGTFSCHRALETDLAEFFQCTSSIVFSTGFLANLGVIAALIGPDDPVLIDGDCHASIYDGCRMSGGRTIRFRHNDPHDLEKRLKRLGGAAEDALVIVEGIYSMFGDRAPLRELVEVTKGFGACLMVDEAHSLGVLGAHGRGLAEEAGCEDEVDILVGTFSKSLGTIGGFCVSRHAELDLIRYASRAYIFTASPSPATMASVRVALKKLAEGSALRERLWENALTLYQGLLDMGFSLGPEPSPVIAVLMPSREKTLFAWKALLDRGVYVNLVLPPATPGGVSLLRCSVSAAHTPDQIGFMLYAFASIGGLARK